eukprot:m.403279 g.403279  ORF g.403279 m.403279 type:complete len:338 (+) comp21191_c1_seq35:279-1292(+)
MVVILKKQVCVWYPILWGLILTLSEVASQNATLTLSSSPAPIKGLSNAAASKTLTVSGLSAGAFMAVQFHFAFSSEITGCGVFAGGPYWCAQDDVEIALHACMVKPSNISPSELAVFTKNAEAVMSIDPLSNLHHDRVYIFSGKQDTVVVPGVADKLETFYSIFVDSAGIKSVRNVSSEHAMPTNNYGNTCGYKGSPYINNCGYDGAFDALNHVLGGGLVRGTKPAARENLRDFSQVQFFPVSPPKIVGMDANGYVYVPKQCDTGETTCQLHVVFHGCEQGAYIINDTFAWNSGYNRHADANNLVILYPQAFPTELNPKVCGNLLEHVIRSLTIDYF